MIELDEATLAAAEAVAPVEHFQFLRLRLPDSQAPVILKTSAPSSPSPVDVARLRWEARTLHTLGHVAGVAALRHEARIPDGRYGLLLEDAGAPLRATGALRADEPLTLERFFTTAIEAVRAVAATHDAGIIHRNLQPSKILVDPETHQVRLVGFDLATDVGTEYLYNPPASTLGGAFAYMSPERSGRANRPVDYRSDYYSLGVTFYEWLCGSPPFSAQDPDEWVLCHLTKEPPNPPAVRPSIPRSLGALIVKLLAKHAEDRYQSDRALIDDLTRCRELYQRDRRDDTFALGEQDHPSIFQVSPRIYGRDAERDRLVAHLERAKAGTVECAIIRGPAGVGKSRLARELSHPARLSRGSFAEAVFDEPRTDGPRAPSGLVRALEQLCEHLAQRSRPRRARLKSALCAALGRNGQVALDLVPGLEALIGPQEPVAELPPHRAHNRRLTTFVTLIEAIARPERPLVLALGEAQWMDADTSNLLEFLLAGDSDAPLLLILSCRDVPPRSRPAPALPLERLARFQRTLELRLDPLGPSDVNRFVADSVVRDPARTRALSDSIYEHTGGSALLVSLVLRQLHREECIYRDATQGAWTWDRAASEALLRAAGTPDGVLARVTALEPSTRASLELAACIGHRFDLRTLAVMAEQPPSAVARELEPALRRGIIIPTRACTRLASVCTDHDEPAATNTAGYRFAAGALFAAIDAEVDPSRRARAHLRVGRHRARGRPLPQLEAHALELVEHFNHFDQATSPLDGPAEREMVLELNLAAARQAVSGAAYEAAAGYATVAHRLLTCEPEPWRRDHATAHRVFIALGEALFLRGDKRRAIGLIEQCIAHAQGDLARAQLLRRIMYLHLFSGDDRLAFASVRRTMLALGYRIPETIHAAHLAVEIARGHLSLRATAYAMLEATPRLDDPRDRLVVELCAEITPSVFRLFGPPGAIYLSLHTLRRLAPKGVSREMALPFVMYGLLLVSGLGDVSRGFAFGKLGLRLASEDGARHHSQSVVTFAFTYFIKPWRDPLREVVPLFDTAVTSGLEYGDHFNASWAAAARAVYAFWSGATLRRARCLFEEADSILAQTRQRGLRTSIALGRRQLSALGGEDSEADPPERLRADFDGAELEFTLGVPIAIFRELLLGELELANHWVQRYEGQLAALARPTLSFSEFRLLAALVSLRRVGRKAARAAKRTLRFLAKWERMAACGFRCRRALLQAELARAEGRTWEASVAYNEALDDAQAQGLIHYQALATEWLAELYLETGAPHLGRPLLRRAMRSYQTWGATEKAVMLQRTFEAELANERATDPVLGTRQWRQDIGRLGSSRRSSASGNTTTRTGSRRRDVLQVLEESRSISSETRKEDLIARVMLVTADLTRAHRVLMVLQQEHGLEVVAEWSNGQTRRLDEPLSRYAGAPRQLVEDACRGGEAVVIVDPSASARPDLPYFSRDPPSSAMCAPVLSQGRSIGGLYAETIGDAVFDRRDVDIAGVVASQAGISLENARLYERVRASSLALESTVRERTEKLRSTQRELLERSRQAGVSDVAINVLHNLGNVLNGATTSASLLKERLEGSEIAKLERVARLLRQNLSDLPAFFSSGRGRALTRYLAALVGELEQERGQLGDEIEHLDASLEQVREAMAAQWSYARSANVIEALDVAALLDDCLMLQHDPGAAEDATVERRYADLPQVRSDRSKLMQLVLYLLSNASEAVARAKDTDARVRVQTRRSSSTTYVIEVRDDGIGITPEVLPRVCERGYTTEAGRAGMGLFRATTLATELGGTLHVHSDGRGHGTLASVELPVELNPETAPPSEPPPRSSPHLPAPGETP